MREMRLPVLDRNPISAAEMLCDDDIIPVLEDVALLLCTISRRNRTREILEHSEQLLEAGESHDTVSNLRIQTLNSFSEPCFIEDEKDYPECLYWIASKHVHWIWTVMFGRSLGAECLGRFKKALPAAEHIWWIGERGIDPSGIDVSQKDSGFRFDFKGINFCFPNSSIVSQEAIKWWRQYYIQERLQFARWDKERKPPYWWPSH